MPYKVALYIYINWNEPLTSVKTTFIWQEIFFSIDRTLNKYFYSAIKTAVQKKGLTSEFWFLKNPSFLYIFPWIVIHKKVKIYRLFFHWKFLMRGIRQRMTIKFFKVFSASSLLCWFALKQVLPHSVPTWNPTCLDLAGCKLGPERACLCTCPPSTRPAGHPATRCFIGFSYFLTSNQKTSFTKSF